jgi:hypothetical protein
LKAGLAAGLSFHFTRVTFLDHERDLKKRRHLETLRNDDKRDKAPRRREGREGKEDRKHVHP